MDKRFTKTSQTLLDIADRECITIDQCIDAFCKAFFAYQEGMSFEEAQQMFCDLTDQCKARSGVAV